MLTEIVKIRIKFSLRLLISVSLISALTGCSINIATHPSSLIPIVFTSPSPSSSNTEPPRPARSDTPATPDPTPTTPATPEPTGDPTPTPDPPPTPATANLVGQWLLVSSSGEIYRYHSSTSSIPQQIGQLPSDSSQFSGESAKVLKDHSGKYLILGSALGQGSDVMVTGGSGVPGNEEPGSAAGSSNNGYIFYTPDFSDGSFTAVSPATPFTPQNISYDGERFWLTVTDPSNSSQTTYFMSAGLTWEAITSESTNPSPVPQSAASGVLKFGSLWLLGNLLQINSDQSAISYDDGSVTGAFNFTAHDSSLTSDLEGLTNFSVKSMVTDGSVVLASSSDTIFGVTSDGFANTIFRSTDGKIWTDEGLTLNNEPWPSSLEPQSMTGHMTASGYYFYVAVSQAPYLLRSSDGIHWSSSNISGIAGQIEFNSLYAQPSGSILLRDTEGLKVSNDGNSFSPVQFNPPASQSWYRAYPDSVLTNQF